MANRLVILGVIPVFLLLVSAKNISEQCKIYNETEIMCRCIGNEELFLPEGYNYENITIFSLSSCISANLHFASLTEALQLEEITIQDISDRLIFEIFVGSKKLRKLRLSNIQRIPVITHNTFTLLRSIERFELENVHIENFEEEFTGMQITEFLVTNSVIERIEEMNFSERKFSEKNRKLSIVNSEFRNISNSLIFVFSDVNIINSTFELSKPGDLVLITSDVTVVENSVFLNASINLVANKDVRINSTCADGKSTLRLSANTIKSFDNRLPTGIIYSHNKYKPKSIVNRNNTVCKGVNCKCQNTNGQNSYRCTSKFSLYILFSIFLVMVI